MGSVSRSGKQIDTQGVECFEYAFNARFCAGSKGFVEALTAHARFSVNLCHSLAT